MVRRFPALIAALVLLACQEGTPTAPLRRPLADLPADLAADTLLAEGTPSSPYVMLELGRTGGFNGYVVVDGRGQIVWFFRTTGAPFSFTRRANGNFVFLDSRAGLLEVTTSGQIVHTLPQRDPPGRFMHHDVAVTPTNTILFLSDDWQTRQDTLFNGAAIWEWNPETGSEEKRWSSFDVLDPSLDRAPRSLPTDWLHQNSLAFGPDGEVLVSLNFLDQVIVLSPDLQRILQRIGGPRGQAVDDPFSGQHTAQEIAPGRLLVFDNGFERPAPGFSRAAEYDITGGSARLVWQWRPPRDNWARVIGSARRLPNGNTLVDFGVPTDLPPGSTGPVEVYEVTPGGTVVWHLVVHAGPGYMYRATPLFHF